MNHDDVQRWLDAYVGAWRANDADTIGALFAEDAAYHYRPYEDVESVDRGRAAIVESWLAEGDDPDSWEAEYTVYAVDGDRAVAIGHSRYLPSEGVPARTFHNCFLLRFDGDGRCAEFTEYYMEEPATGR